MTEGKQHRAINAVYPEALKRKVEAWHLIATVCVFTRCIFPLQVTRPLNYTKRQFDVEEEDVDKLALRCVVYEHPYTVVCPQIREE